MSRICGTITEGEKYELEKKYGFVHTEEEVLFVGFYRVGRRRTAFESQLNKEKADKKEDRDI